METEKICFRAGVAALALATLFRLGADGALGAVMETLATPEAAGVILFLESGRVVRPAEPKQQQQSTQPTAAPETVSQVPQETQPAALAVFAPSDEAFVEVNNYSGKTADVKELLQKPLNWQLQQQEPTVLILHSHGTESYTKTEDYKETTKYRTRDSDYNVVSVGARLAQVLEAGGVRVIHDTVMHDESSYNNSYNHARASTKEYLEKYPSVSLVLDIHRDAVENKNGEQVKFTAKTEKGTSAQLMLVVGTNARLKHTDWPENMALAVKLHALLEKNYPGICRPISFRAQRFNQDLSPGALIVEVGTAGNDRQEALLAAEILGETILSMAQGAVTEDSTR